MVRLTQSNVGDMEGSDPRIDRGVLRSGEQILRNINTISGGTREALTRYGGIFPTRVSRDSDRLRWEAWRQERDIQPENRTGLQREAADFRAARLALPEEGLARTRNRIDVTPNEPIVFRNVAATGPGGTNATVDIEIRHDAGFWRNQQLNANFATILGTLTPALMASRGITVRGANFHHFTPEQIAAIAQQFTATMMGFQNLSRLFAANGTSEINIQSALSIAREHPQEVFNAVTTNPAEAETLYQESRAKLLVSRALTDLSALTRVDGSHNFVNAVGQLTAVRDDIRDISNFNTRTSRSTRGDELFAAGLSMPAHEADIRRGLADEERTLAPIVARYRQIESALQRIYANARAANIVVPAITAYITPGTHTINPALIDQTVDPRVIADQLTLALNLGNAESIQAEINTRDAARKNVSAAAPSSREAIIRTYAIHFEHQGLSAEAARQQADKLYGLNAIGQSEWAVAKQTMQRQDVLGKEARILDWPKNQMNEVLRGSQESFICHIAESLAIGLQPETSNRFRSFIPFVGPRFTRVLDDTRRFGLLWRKTHARPAWGAMDYHQLAIAFYAIRNAVKAKDIANTSYVRNTLDEIMRILLDKFSVNIARDYGAADIPEDQRRDAESVHQQRNLQDQIRLFIAGEPPAEIAGDVNSAITEAREQTGKWRKWAGRIALNSTGFGEKTIVSKPAHYSYVVAKSPIDAGRWGLGKIGSGIKYLWDKGNEKTKVF